MCSTIGQARSLRKRQTMSEVILWGSLRNRQLGGFKFRRQHGIGKYIVDFCCVSERLIIEIDGDVHAFATQRKRDKVREDFLLSRHFRVIRYTSHEVYENLHGVLEDLLERCEESGRSERLSCADSERQ